VFLAPHNLTYPLNGGRNQCEAPPIVTVDAAHTHKCGGVVFTMVMANAHNEIHPLAFAIARVESKDSWLWFFQNCCAAMPQLLAWGSKLVVIVDGNASIRWASKRVLPSSNFFHCVKHRARDVAKRFAAHADKAKIYRLWWVVCGATCKRDCQAGLEEVRRVSPEAFDYFTTRPREESFPSYMPTCCGGKYTSNDAGTCAVSHCRCAPY